MSQCHSRNKNIAIVDIDSTIVDPKPRIIGLWNDWLDSQVGLSAATSKQARRLTLESAGCGFQDCIRQFEGVAREELLKYEMSALDFWEENFWKSSYLAHDKAYPGAIPFFQWLAGQMEIVFLSGRLDAKMRDDTEAMIKSFNIVPEANLKILMNKGETDHAAYKLRLLSDLVAKKESVFVFDDDLSFLRQAAQAKLITRGFLANIGRFRHGSNAVLMGNVVEITDYALELKRLSELVSPTNK